MLEYFLNTNNTWIIHGSWSVPCNDVVKKRRALDASSGQASCAPDGCPRHRADLWFALGWSRQGPISPEHFQHRAAFLIKMDILNFGLQHLSLQIWCLHFMRFLRWWMMVVSLLGWRSQEITGWAENDRGVFLIQTGKLQIGSEGYVRTFVDILAPAVLKTNVDVMFLPCKSLPPPNHRCKWICVLSTLVIGSTHIWSGPTLLARPASSTPKTLRRLIRPSILPTCHTNHPTTNQSASWQLSRWQPVRQLKWQPVCHFGHLYSCAPRRKQRWRRLKSPAIL